MSDLRYRPITHNLQLIARLKNQASALAVDLIKMILDV